MDDALHTLETAYLKELQGACERLIKANRAGLEEYELYVSCQRELCKRQLARRQVGGELRLRR